MSERHDLGRAVGDNEGTWLAQVDRTGTPQAVGLEGEAIDIYGTVRPFHPTIYLYDNYPGGIGIAASLYDASREILVRTNDLVERCAC